MADREAPVELALTIAARPETIFRYFTDPARFARWMGEGSVLDATPGGRRRIGYHTGQVAGGRVVAVEPDRRIVFTQNAGRVSTSRSRALELRHASACASGTPDRRSVWDPAPGPPEAPQP